MQPLVASFILGVCLLVVTVCGPGSTNATVPQASPMESASGDQQALLPLATGSPPPGHTVTEASSAADANLAPDFSFTLFQGEDILEAQDLKLSQLRGKPVVLNFWARLCPPCWTEMPELQAFYEEFQDQVGLLGIDIGQFTGLGSYRDARKLLEATGVTYPVGFTDDAKIVQKYRVVAMPTTVFIDSDGRIFRRWNGALDQTAVTRLAKAMLKP